MAGEAARLSALDRYGLTQGEWDDAQPALDSAVRLTAQLVQVPIAAIHIITEREAVRVAAVGVPLERVPRSASMCNVSMLRPEPVVIVHDAQRNPAFAANPHVTGDLARVRFYAAVPLLADDGSALGTLCAWSDEPRESSAAMYAGLQDLGVLVSSQLESRRISIASRLLASLDPLTGLPNRRTAQEYLEAELRGMNRGARLPATLAVLMVDVAGLQTVNDTFGHQTGDAVLVEAAQRLRGAVRSQDFVARWGGDEFVIIADTAAPQVAGQLRHRIETGLAQVEPFHPGIKSTARLSLRASVGAATAWRGCTPAELVHAADQAMYAVKRASA